MYLFVVNHPQHKSQVEIFHFVEENTLVHLKTITHPLLHRYVHINPSQYRTFYISQSLWRFIWFILSFSVNDIVAVGVESFYATNDHSFTNEVLHFVTVLLGLHWCDVVYYSPKEVRVAASGILSGNGINISPDKRFSQFILAVTEYACFTECICTVICFICNAKIMKQESFSFSGIFMFQILSTMRLRFMRDEKANNWCILR